MPDRQVVTRESLRRELVVNAATKPLAIVVATALVAGAFLLGATWLIAAAAVLYIALAAATFFDADEAERVGRAVYARVRALPGGERALPKGLTPEIASLVERARVEERRIVQAIAESELPFTEVSVEVDSLAAEMERIAGRAQLIWNYLSEQRPYEVQRRVHALKRELGGTAETVRARDRAAAALEAQLDVGQTLRAELDRFEAEMEHLIASLGVVHGQLVRMSVVDETHLQEDVAGQVRDLRERVASVADGLREAVAQLEDEPRA